MMRSIPSRQRHGAGPGRPEVWFRGRGGLFCALACCAALAVSVGVGVMRGHAQASFPLPSFDPPRNTSSPTPATQKEPQAAKAQAPVSTEAAHKQEIAGECADLLKMAMDLKTEVDKTNKDTLSLAVVRKASEIEQLARKVRTGSPRD